ncbi:MAG: MtnX-like HAD-IB family phosphatase [Candidatus Latescibacterota bacterium]
MYTGSLRIFVDFDGTITSRDVGDSIFERFLRPDLLARGWHEEMIREWKAGRISSRDCLLRECENTVVTREELDALLDEHTITPGFAQLVSYCAGNDIPLCILSDGLDYYIEFILAKYGLSETPYHANHMFFTETALGVDFPYVDKGCGRCANCKRWHIESIRRNGEKTVYIGDGYSDRYAIKSVDTVFARDDLAEYCDTRGIEYIPFQHFYDVLRYLENGDGEI